MRLIQNDNGIVRTWQNYTDDIFSEVDDDDDDPSSELHNPTSSATKKRGVKSFCIDDILSHKTAALKRSGGNGGQAPIVRPWDRLEGRREDVDERRKSLGDSPLGMMAINIKILALHLHYS